MTSRCGGKGYTEHVHRDYAPDTVTVRSCPGCEDCAKPCATCGGTGRKPTTLQGSTTTQWHSVHCPACNGKGVEP